MTDTAGTGGEVRRPFVLVVEDNPLTLKFFLLVLSHAGFEVEGARRAVGDSGALAIAEKRCPDALVVDQVLPGSIGGCALIEMVRDAVVRDPGAGPLPAVIVTGAEWSLPDLPPGVEVLIKPVGGEKLIAAVTRLIS